VNDDVVICGGTVDVGRKVCGTLPTSIREPVTLAVLFWMFSIVLAWKILYVLTNKSLFNRKLENVIKTH